jgi:hypothetical protein
VKLVACKAQGSRRIVARRKAPTVPVAEFTRAFGAVPVGIIRDDANPLSLLQFRSQLEKRLGERRATVACDLARRLGLKSALSGAAKG